MFVSPPIWFEGSVSRRDKRRYGSRTVKNCRVRSLVSEFTQDSLKN